MAIQSDNNLHIFQQQSMKLLSGIMEVDRVASYLYDEQNKLTCFQVQQIQPAMHRDYQERFYKYDPLHLKNFNSPDVDIITNNELVAPKDRSDHVYYREFLAAWRIKDIIEVRMYADQRMVAGFALFLDEHRKEFLNKEINQLKQLHDYMQFSLEQVLGSPEQINLHNFCAQHSLTPKEKMVVELILQGLPNKTIAEKLCCSLATVKTHLQNIFFKLEVNSKAEVASLLYRFLT